MRMIDTIDKDVTTLKVHVMIKWFGTISFHFASQRRRARFTFDAGSTEKYTIQESLNVEYLNPAKEA